MVYGNHSIPYSSCLRTHINIIYYLLLSMAIFNHNKYIDVQSIILISTIFQIRIFMFSNWCLIDICHYKLWTYLICQGRIAIPCHHLLQKTSQLWFTRCNECTGMVLLANKGITIHINGWLMLRCIAHLGRDKLEWSLKYFFFQIRQLYSIY